MSRGWTTRVATEPPAKPPTVSTKAGERPACWRVIERRYLLFGRLFTINITLCALVS